MRLAEIETSRVSIHARRAVRWRRVLAFVLSCAFTLPLAALAVYVVRDQREREALRELGERATETASALTPLLSAPRLQMGSERVMRAELPRQSVVLDPGLVYVAHPKLGARRGVLLPVEVAESLQRASTTALLLQDYRDPLDSTGARWLAAFAPVGQTGYFSAVQVRAPAFAVGTALGLGVGLATLLWALSAAGSRSRLGA